jgi:hypothetical protein
MKVARQALAASGLLISAATPAFAGDAFFKGGFIVHPRQTDLADRWLIAFGTDYPVDLSETIYAGVDLQTGLYRESGLDGSVTVLPAHGYINAKYKAPTSGARPYAGVGIGVLSFFTFTGDETFWDRDGAFHLLGGVEVGGLTLELQAGRRFAGGDRMSYLALIGFVW